MSTPTDLIRNLREIVGTDHVLWQREDLKPYECGGLMMYRQVPHAVVLPADASQVQAVLKACHAARVPVIARGAGTGLSGGATPREGAILLSLARVFGAATNGRDNRCRCLRRVISTAVCMCGCQAPRLQSKPHTRGSAAKRSRATVFSGPRCAITHTRSLPM